MTALARPGCGPVRRVCARAALGQHIGVQLELLKGEVAEALARRVAFEDKVDLGMVALASDAAGLVNGFIT
jgi:hypothetical protein